MKESLNYHVHEYDYNEFGIKVKVTRLEQDKGDVKAYIKFDADLYKHPHLDNPHIMFTRHNLSSGTTRIRLGKDLETRLPLDHWAGILEQVCSKSIDAFWQGSPIIKLGKQPKRKEIPYLLYPMVRKNAPCIIFGPGGIGKSYLSLYISLLVQHNITISGLLPQQANVLYLDYESGDEDLNDRLAALSKGLGLEVELNYRYRHQPLVDDIVALSDMILENDIGMVIVDAKGAAVGGWINEARQTMDMFNSLRSLNVTSIIIDHVSKENQDAPIGSIYNFNESRNIWKLRKTESNDPGTLILGLSNEKSNSGRKHPHMAMKFVFKDDEYGNVDTVWVSETEVEEHPDLMQDEPTPRRIQHLLRGNVDMSTGLSMPMSPDDIAQSLGIKKSTVQSRLSDGAYSGKPGWWARIGKGQFVYLPETNIPDTSEEIEPW